MAKRPKSKQNDFQLDLFGEFGEVVEHEISQMVESVNKLQSEIDQEEGEPYVFNSKRSIIDSSTKNHEQKSYSNAENINIIQSEGMENSGQMGFSTATTSSTNTTAVRNESVDENTRPTNFGRTDNGTGQLNTDAPKWNDRDGDIGSQRNTDTASTIEIAEVENYTITDKDNLGEGGARTRFKNNIAALKLLNSLKNENRQASQEEQGILVKYVGWGGIPQAFDDRNYDWSNEYNELLQVLPSNEYEKARRSTQDSHYTSKSIINGIYKGIERTGFKGGDILEPSCGIGHFVGLIPNKLANDSNFTCIELDPLSSSIAKQLYPNINIINKGFQDINLPNGSFDIAVGNPPFGSQKLNDFQNPELAEFSIHNYFMAKTLNAVKPGGITAFVVSKHFLDSNNKKAREYIAERAHFLGAIRLPSAAFKNAGTDVTTDIIFLQKALPDELINKDWIEIKQILGTNSADLIDINNYFYQNPNQMIGRMEVTNKGRIGRVDCVLDNPAIDLEQAIEERLAVIPSNCYLEKTTLYEALNSYSNDDVPITEEKEVIKALDNDLVQVGSYFVTPKGKLAIRDTDQLDTKTKEFRVGFNYYEPKNATEDLRIKGLIEIRDTVYTLLNHERDDYAGDDHLLYLRNTLNIKYDKYIKKYGFLNSQVNRSAFVNDPSYALLQSLERDYDKGISKTVAEKTGEIQKPPSALKADIFTQRVLQPKRKITHVDSAVDALTICKNERGYVDPEFMSRITGKSFKDELLKELGDLVFEVPGQNKYETKDIYLTGEVKEKLAIAKNLGFERNVRALEAVQPDDIDPIDISIQINSSWLPQTDLEKFVQHLLGKNINFNYRYVSALGTWVGGLKADRNDVANISQWGTVDYRCDELISSLLTNSSIRVMEEVGKDEKGRPMYKLNVDKTAAALQKADEIKQAFQDWIWNDEERRERLAKHYNAIFNTHVTRKYDGSHLTFENLSQSITLRPHQKDAIWRGIQEGKGLFDHVVGAGKTMVCIGTMLESKRMGLVNKPMVCVPNHLLLQWKDEIYKLYPDAKVLVAGKDDFKKENRKKLFGKIATGNWDAVIIGHSSFKKIGMPEKMLDDILFEQVNDIVQAIRDAESENSQNNKHTIKQLELLRERLEAKLEKKADQSEKDKVVTFDQLGIDCLFVDESQEFKNLYIATKMNNIAGLGNLTGSDKAFDLFVKARYLQRKYDGKGIYFATGTPISNSIAETFTLQRYMQYDELKKLGIQSFDGWASTFGQVTAGWELDATGVNYKINNRFAKFQNVPELMHMYRSFADVITLKDLQQQASDRGERFPVPKVKGGRPQNIVVERSENQAEYMGVLQDKYDEAGNRVFDTDGLPVKEYPEETIIYRMEHLPKDPSIDNPLKITNDARKAGLDFRLIDASSEDDKNSKINVAIEKIYEIWQNTANDKGTQLVFCDLSTPKKKRSKRIAQTDTPDELSENIENEQEADDISVSMDELLAEEAPFSVYDDIKQKLIDKGIPENEIKFIHDSNTDLQKQKLFADMNSGRIRILLGSTFKMGAGTNVQRRLVAEHHLDCPWRPSDLEQREGRIIRQGNMLYERDPDNFEVEILRYATKQTYDARMWQVIEQKATAIEQFRRGDMLQRVIDDVVGEAANAAEMKAASTGNPLIFAQVQLASELKKMEAVFSSFKRTNHNLESRIKRQIDQEKYYLSDIEETKQNILIRDQNILVDKPQWAISVKDKIYKSTDDKPAKEELARSILEAFKDSKGISQRGGTVSDTRKSIGSYKGFKLSVTTHRSFFSDNRELHVSIKGHSTEVQPKNLIYGVDDKFSLSGFITRLDNYIDKLEETLTEQQETLMRSKDDIEKAKEQLNKPFVQQAYLDALREDSRQVLTELRLVQADERYQSNWVPKTESFGLSLGIHEANNTSDNIPAHQSDHSDISDEDLEEKTMIKAVQKYTVH